MKMKCLVCGDLATKYCDALIGYGIESYHRKGDISENIFYALTGINCPIFTCDAPLCDRHTERQGTSFYANDIDSIDHCQAIHNNPTPMTEKEADEIRRGLYAKLRRLGLLI